MSTAAAQQSYTVLRIKRKATDPPLSSLVIQDQLESRARKRRDVSIRQRGVFRLAETVPETWQGQGEEGDELRTRIRSLLDRRPAPPTAVPAAPAPASASSASTLTDIAAPPTSAATEPGPSDAFSSAAASPASQARPAASDAGPSRATRVQYRVVAPPRARAPPSIPGLPPRVLSREEAASQALVFVDAQAVSAAVKAAGGDADDETVAAFLPMLQEYLTLDQNRSRAEEEYVYDLYYRDVRPGAAGEAGAAVGALWVLPPGRGDRFFFCASADSSLGYDDLSPPSSPEESEVEDEADEDSNDEDYYANDYPEDEDADEDMVAYEDAYSDGEWSREDDDDEGGSDDEARGGGGVWDYR